MPAQFGLLDWNDLAAGTWPNLLLGNGLGISVSEKFAYKSLFEAADLELDDAAVFDALSTQNFEMVLAYLRIAKLVCGQLHGGSDEVQLRYDSIRAKLITTVNDHHVAWNDVPDDRVERIRTALRGFKKVWTTSYDLIPYWAIMSGGTPGAGFADAFWGAPFDPANTEPLDPDRTRVWYVHGALHLYRLSDGSTVKPTNVFGQNLLSLLNTGYGGADVPLFVSEGTASDKLGSIRASDYLSTAYNELAVTDGPIVVCGQSLSDVDVHLVDAIIRRPDRNIAYGVYAADQQWADLERARVAVHFPQASLSFFDSTTHPLMG